MRAGMQFSNSRTAFTFLISAYTSLVAANAAAQPDVRALTQEAQQAYGSRNFAVAETKYKSAIELAVKVPSKQGAVIQTVLLSNLGAVYREAHKYDDAEKTFKRALALAEQAGLMHEQSTILTMKQYALLLRKMKRDQDADAVENRANSSQTTEALYGMRAASLPAGQRTDEVDPPTITLRSKTPEPDFGVETDERKYAAMSIDKLKESLGRQPDDLGAWIELARKSTKQKDWSNAILAHQNILKRYPELEKLARRALAEAYYRNHQWMEAVDECKRIVQGNPDDADAYRIMSASYSCLGDLRSQLECDQIFVERCVGHPDHDTIAQNIPNLKRDIADLAKQQQQEAKPSQWEETHCWTRAPMPLKVYIYERDSDEMKLDHGHSLITDNTPGEIIQRAMEAWTQASEGRISFQMVPVPEQADIVCSFTNNKEGMENAMAAGVTTWELDSARRQARIKLLAVRVHEPSKPVDKGFFYETCLHEFGHALGLEHSSGVHDVMYRAVHPEAVTTLSENDKARVVRLYKLGH